MFAEQIDAGVRSGVGRVRLLAALPGHGADLVRENRQGGGALRRQLVGQPPLRQQLRQHRHHGELRVVML
jgi:hypothetical protein